MTAGAVLASAAAVLLLPLVVAGARRRTLLAMARRNVVRRRGDAALVVAGAMLGTAVITSSLVVGDVIEGSFADAARTRYGPVDVVLSPPAGTNPRDLADAADRIAGIDGLLPATIVTATIEAPTPKSAAPQVRVVELDVAAARTFGSDPAVTGLADTAAPSPGGIVLNERTARQIRAAAGDELRVHAYGSHIRLVVSDVVPEIGLAGYGGALVGPDTLDRLAADASVAAVRPQPQLLVSVDGGVFDTRAPADTVAGELSDVLPAGVAVTLPKADVLDDARRTGGELTTVFTMIGSFSVIAGILLLVNLFAMLAEERKTELGMLRAVGFTRRRLVHAFALEGALYAVLASAAGAVAGLGIGWLVAMVAGRIFTGGEGARFPMVVSLDSLATGAAAGLAISLLTIWVTSLRIARLNIIRAIRDLEAPRGGTFGRRARVLSLVGVVAGAGVGVLGFAGEIAVPLLIGPTLAAFAALPLLGSVLGRRVAGLAVSVGVLAWTLGLGALFPAIMNSGDMAPFVVQGVVLTAGAVSLTANLDRVWMWAIEHIGRGGRGLALRLGVAYPLARRFRTAMLLAMFSLVIFTVTVMTTFSGSFAAGSDSTIRNMSAGFDLAVDFNPANPVDVGQLADRSDVAAVAGLRRSGATFTAAPLDGTRQWPISGFDADLLVHGGPDLGRRAEHFDSDAEVFDAVLHDPTLAIVPENFLVTAADSAPLDLGDTFTVVGTGGRRELMIAAIGDTDWLEGGALVSSEVTAALFGADDVVTRAYVRVHDGLDPAAVAARLNAEFLAHGVNARTFTAVAAGGAKALTGFLALLRGFLTFGLLVGIAGLAVVMVRAVRERRREIGMLRAMGFGSALVRMAMLSEAGLVAAQGTLIGAVLGLVTARQMLAASESAAAMDFVVPWGPLLTVVGLPLLASLAATAWPASRAAAIRPAIALRTAD